MYKIIGNTVFLIAAAVLLASCGGKEEKREYSARVEKDYLFKSTLDSVLTTEKYRNYFKDEYINKWVHDRLLYNEAVKNGILDDPGYKKVIENIKEEAAIAVYIQKLNNEFDLSFTENDLEDFYKGNAEEFRCGDDAYVFNEIKFVSYDRAVQFRTTLLETGWDNTLKVFKNDPTIRANLTKKFAFGNQIQPYEIFKIVVNMQENDVSILTETEPGVFTIVQLVKSFAKDSVPEYEYITGLVKERYLMVKRKTMIDELIQKLYSKYDIEIKKDI